jgi:hypothetical protein
MPSMSSSKSDNNTRGENDRICVTRGLKNASYIEKIDPLLAAQIDEKGITSLIPPIVLNKLQTIARPQAVIENKELALLMIQIN